MNIVNSNYPLFFRTIFGIGVFVGFLFLPGEISATPANRAALAKHFDKYLPKNLNKCTTCHLQSEIKNPETLGEFPHNPFGARLRTIGKELADANKKKEVPDRLALIASEDADRDGVDNLTEILLGHSPGNDADKPTETELAEIKTRRGDFEKFIAGYRWQPFETVRPVPVPLVKNKNWVRNPIDAFVVAEHEAKKLKPRPEAPRDILLRRVYLDLIGLTPTPGELANFEKDKSPDAYEKVVDRLLADPRHGERWGRHWMDVWRYSDWAGYNAEIRDSKPHIWRWRDWIVESLNEDKPYDKMLQEMLAADELDPVNTNALRATGFLVRNYKMLSREQWLTDTVHHTSKAFLGTTMNCAKCHDHMYDPISQADYYKFRAIFEPHYVRMDRIPGQYDTNKDALVRVFDVATNSPTYIFNRGDERSPDTNRVMSAGVPAIFGGTFKVEPVKLPLIAAYPARREFEERESIVVAEKAVPDARAAFEKIKAEKTPDAKKLSTAELKFNIAEAHLASLVKTLKAEHLEDAGKRDSEEWKTAAIESVVAQRNLAVFKATQELGTLRDKEAEVQTRLDKKKADLGEAEKNKKEQAEIEVFKNAVEKATADLVKAKEKTVEAEKLLADAQKANAEPPNTAYKPSAPDIYPEVSTGRRSALALWLTEKRNPLTARVAMNHIWLRHIGQAIVPTTSNFGLSGQAPTHPQLLDWLATEFMAKDWSMKAMHRLIMTSSTYRMAATLDEKNMKIDSENVFLWRMPSRRIEAEAVRDNLLYVGGNLDSKMGGPEIPAAQGLTSKRRSIYLRIAAEKEVEFLKIFDGPDPIECYARRPSVMPHQALALANSELALAQAKLLTEDVAKLAGDNEKKFINEAFVRVLSREPNGKEIKTCVDFLKEQQTRFAALPKTEVAEEKDKAKSKNASMLSTSPVQRAREDLILVLFNHNDFVTVR